LLIVVQVLFASLSWMLLFLSWDEKYKHDRLYGAMAPESDLHLIREVQREREASVRWNFRFWRKRQP
jgi:hypothetical protein